MRQSNFKKYARLLTEARNGNEEAFREIYRETSPSQLYHLQTLLNDPEEVKDALQEVYILLYKNLDKINPPTVLVAYLNRLSYYVGKNIAKVRYRRTSRLTVLDWLEDVEEPSAADRLEEMENIEQSDIVRKTVKQLPEPEQSVIYMRYYQGLKHQEVALSLGISQASAKRIQHSAHDHMRELLKSEGISAWGLAVAWKLKSRTLPKQPKSNTRTLPPGSTAMASAAGTGLLAAMAAAGLSIALLGSGMTEVPVINQINVACSEARSFAQIDVRIESPLPIRRIEVRGRNNAAAYGVRTDTNTYTATVTGNGRYIITAVSNSGRTAEKTIYVEGIDKSIPKASSFVKEDKLYVTFEEDESGIDYSDLYCEGSSGRIMLPEEIDPPNNRAVFRLPMENAMLYMRDNAGNRGRIPIQYHDSL